MHFSTGNYNRGSVVKKTISLDNRFRAYSDEILQSVTKRLNFEDNNTMWLDKSCSTYSAQILQSVTKTLNFEEHDENEEHNGDKNSLNVIFNLVNCF